MGFQCYSRAEYVCDIVVGQRIEEFDIKNVPRVEACQW
jgi:hypothetical protein